MRAKAFPGEDPKTLPTPEDVVPLFLELVSPACDFNGRVVSFREWQRRRVATSHRHASDAYDPLTPNSMTMPS